MRLTEARQGVRMLKFMDVFGRWDSAELNQVEAAELLGVGERTFRRWCRRYEEDGEGGLLDRRIGKASGKRVPVDRCEEVERLYRTRYQGFTARHFHEHLVRDHRFAWSYSWTKAFLQRRGRPGLRTPPNRPQITVRVARSGRQPTSRGPTSLSIARDTRGPAA